MLKREKKFHESTLRAAILDSDLPTRRWLVEMNRRNF